MLGGKPSLLNLRGVVVRRKNFFFRGICRWVLPLSKIIKKSKPLQIQNHDDLEENDSRDFPSGKKGNESSLSFLNPKRIELSFL